MTRRESECRAAIIDLATVRFCEKSVKIEEDKALIAEKKKSTQVVPAGF